MKVNLQGIKNQRNKYLHVFDCKCIHRESIHYFIFYVVLLDGMGGAYRLRDVITKISSMLLDIHELPVHTLGERICKNAFTKRLCLQNIRTKMQTFKYRFSKCKDFLCI